MRAGHGLAGLLRQGQAGPLGPGRSAGAGAGWATEAGAGWAARLVEGWAARAKNMYNFPVSKSGTITLVSFDLYKIRQIQATLLLNTHICIQKSMNHN